MSGANPFVGYGTVASGERFVGREAEMAALRRRLYEARSSAALIGLTRMGKSSLANKIISEPPDARTTAGWVNIATAQSGAEVFADILAMCPSPEALHVTFTTAGSPGGAQDVPIHGLYRLIRDALLRLRRTGGHLVVVLDEFDSSATSPTPRVPQPAAGAGLLPRPDPDGGPGGGPPAHRPYRGRGRRRLDLRGRVRLDVPAPDGVRADQGHGGALPWAGRRRSR